MDTAGKTVTLYVKPSSVECTAAIRHMNSFGIQYETEDVTRNPAALKEIEGLGYDTYPITVVGDVHWSGFEPALIHEHLRYK